DTSICGRTREWSSRSLRCRLDSTHARQRCREDVRPAYTGRPDPMSATVAFFFSHRHPVAGLALRASDAIAFAPLGLLDHDARPAWPLDNDTRPPRLLDFHARRTDAHIDIGLRRRDHIHQGNGDCRGSSCGKGDAEYSHGVSSLVALTGLLL